MLRDGGADQRGTQVGTIVEGKTEFYSGRLSKKERKSNLAEEILAGALVSVFFLGGGIVGLCWCAGGGQGVR